MQNFVSFPTPPLLFESVIWLWSKMDFSDSIQFHFMNFWMSEKNCQLSQCGSSGYTFISVITRQIGNGTETGGGGYQMKVSPLLSYLQNYLFTKKFKMFFQTFVDSCSKNQQYTVVENYPKKVSFFYIYAILGSRCLDNQMLFAKFCSHLF